VVGVGNFKAERLSAFGGSSLSTCYQWAFERWTHWKLLAHVARRFNGGFRQKGAFQVLVLGFNKLVCFVLTSHQRPCDFL